MTSSFKTLQEAEQYCNSFISPTGHSKERSLIRMKRLMNTLGNPQKNLIVVHVGGSSGKGSTAYMIATLLEQSGLKVGLHIKPHLQSITERIAINREIIPDSVFVSYVNLVKQVIDNLVQKDKTNTPTYFELLVAITLLYFKDQHVDIAVLEVGRGGRVDATNICPSKLFVLTNISLVHTAILGKTLKEITEEKMGIIKTTTTVVTGATQPSVRSIIRKICKATNSPLIIVSPHTSCDIYQKQNAALAVMATKQLVALSDTQIQTALQTMKLPGRLETIQFKGHTLILDSAHNPTNLRVLVRSIQYLYPDTKMTVVLPFQQARMMKEQIKILTPITSTRILVLPTKTHQSPHKKNKTAIYPETLCSVAQCKEILSHTTDSYCLITGSMTLLGLIRTSLHIPFRLK